MKKLFSTLILGVVFIVSNAQRYTVDQVKAVWDGRVMPSTTNIDSTWNAVFNQCGTTSGTTNRYARFGSASTLTNANLSDTGKVTFIPTGYSLAGEDSTQGRLIFGSATSSLYSGYNMPFSSSLILTNYEGEILTIADSTSTYSAIQVDTTTINLLSGGTISEIATGNISNTSTAGNFNVTLAGGNETHTITGNLALTNTGKVTITTDSTYTLICDSVNNTVAGGFKRIVSGDYLNVIGDSVDFATGKNFTITTTTGALIFPRLTTTQRNNLTAIKGMVIYNTSVDSLQLYNGAWTDL